MSHSYKQRTQKDLVFVYRGLRKSYDTNRTNDNCIVNATSRRGRYLFVCRPSDSGLHTIAMVVKGGV